MEFENKLTDALLKCAQYRVEKTQKTVFINRSPYVNAEGLVRSFIDDFDIDEYRTVLYIDYNRKHHIFELSSADPKFSIELKESDPMGNGIFRSKYLVNGSQTVEIWDDDFYYCGIKNGSERIDKSSYGEKREALNPNGFGAFGKNLHTQFDRCIITNIIFAANCDSPSPHIMIDSPQCLAYGHLIWYNLFVTTSAPKFILPDSKTIISMSFDGTVRIWDASTGVCLNTLEVDSHSVSYSPDSRTIVIASFDKTVRIYAIQSFQEMLEITRERFKDRQLTPEERHRYYLD